MSDVDYAEILRLARKYRRSPKESLAEIFIRVGHDLEATTKERCPISPDGKPIAGRG
jgi:hypothetical protein